MNNRIAALASSKPAPPGAMAGNTRKKSRNSDRKTTFRFGRVTCTNREEYTCILRDLSETGAKLVFEGEVALSPQVTLRIEQTGEYKRARVVWQKEREAGLAFE